MELGTNIRQRRQAAGMSQEELAKRVYVVRQTVLNWEHGKTMPDLESLKRLADVFGTTVDDLLGSDAGRILRESAADRRELEILIALQAYLCLAWAIVLGIYSVFTAHAFRGLGEGVPLSWVFLTVFIIVLPLFAVNVRLGRIQRRCDLHDQMDIAWYLAADLEERRGLRAFVYRKIMPYWRVYGALFDVAVMLMIVLFGVSNLV